MENYKELAEVVLPEGILDYFDCMSARVIENVITIRLQEKDWVPEIPEEYRGKKVTSKGFKDFSVEDFPVRGKKVKLLVRRRVWKVEGMKDLLKREIPVTFPNTKLQKEFAIFLKGGGRTRAGRDLENSQNI